MQKRYTLASHVLFDSTKSCPSYVKINSQGSGYLSPRSQRRARSISLLCRQVQDVPEWTQSALSARGMNTSPDRS